MEYLVLKPHSARKVPSGWHRCWLSAGSSRCCNCESAVWLPHLQFESLLHTFSGV